MTRYVQNVIKACLQIAYSIIAASLSLCAGLQYACVCVVQVYSLWNWQTSASVCVTLSGQ